MQDKQLLADLLAAETEEAALEILNKRGLLNEPSSAGASLGGMPNNQSDRSQPADHRGGGAGREGDQRH